MEDKRRGRGSGFSLSPLGHHRGRPLLLASFALAHACASSQTPVTTWEDDEREGILNPTRPRSPARAPTLSPEITLDPDAVGEQLERALLVFGAEQRRKDASPPPSRTEEWPHHARLSWGRLLKEVERAFTQPWGALPTRLLIQVRVVLDAERERWVRRFGPPPTTIDRRIASAFVQIARRLEDRRRTDPSGTRETSLVLRWPVSPIVFTSHYGYRRDPIYRDGRLGFHAGIDLAGRRGDPIYAAGPGEVIFAGWNGGLGRSVFLQHVQGYVTVYAHLSRVLVRPGMVLDTESVIGLMGSTGRATGAHLHFEIRLGGTPLDPLPFLGGQRRPTSLNAPVSAATTPHDHQSAGKMTRRATTKP